MNNKEYVDTFHNILYFSTIIIVVNNILVYMYDIVLQNVFHYINIILLYSLVFFSWLMIRNNDIIHKGNIKLKLYSIFILLVSIGNYVAIFILKLINNEKEFYNHYFDIIYSSFILIAMVNLFTIFLIIYGLIRLERANADDMEELKDFKYTQQTRQISEEQL